MQVDTVPDLSRYLRSGDTVLWGQATAEPLTLTRALVAQRAALGRLRVFLGIGLAQTLMPEHAESFEFVSYCGTGSNRQLAKAGVLDVMPCPYSRLSHLLREGSLKVDVVFLQVSEPDSEGRYSLGLANDLLLAALDSARIVMAEVNPDVPWTYGARSLHADDIDVLVPASGPPLENFPAAVTAIDRQIAGHVASLIDDGATLQVGLGGVPETVLGMLTDRKDLGLHTGIIGDGLVDLVQSGAMTNARKSIDTGYSVAGVLTGSQRLFRFAHRNPTLQMRGSEYTHGSAVLNRIDRFAAINSAVEVDLTGQANAEIAGGIYLGAVGGAPDFLRAAHLSRGGLPVIALRATAGEHSRIVAALSGPTTTARCDAGIIVTEYGIADLRGLSVKARVRRMIDIAAPEKREALERAAHV